MNRLSKIVHKIANYVPWQSEGLTEDEFKVLDEASGIELADIAYNNRINFNRFLRNADKMIDTYNEQLYWAQIKEVRALKRCLLNSVPFNAPHKLLQREIPVQNDDNVVPQLELPQSPPENARIAVEEVPVEIGTDENAAAQTVPNTRTFVSGLLAENSGMSRSIPMHRNAIQRIGHVDNFIENDVPILNENEMTQMGVFDGLHGRKISRVLHQREEAASTSALNIDIAQPNILPIEDDMNPPSIDNMDHLLLTPSADPYDIEELNRIQQIEPLQIDEQQPNQVVREPTSPEIPIIQIVNAEQSQHEQNENECRENITNGQDSMAERAEFFRNAVEAAESFLGRARRVVRRGNRVNRQRPPPREENVMVMQKLRKDVPFKTKRRNRARPIKPLKLLLSDLDFFADIEVYVSNDLPFEEQEVDQVPQRRESDFNLEFNPVTTHHRVLTSTPMNTGQNKRLISSPENLDHDPKRTRLQTLDDARNYLLNLPDPTESIVPNPEVPQESDFEVPVLNPFVSAQQPVQQPSQSIAVLPLLEPSLTIPPIQQESIQTSVVIPQLPQQQDIEPSITIPASSMQRQSLPPLIELPEPEQQLEISLPTAEQSVPEQRRQSRLAILQNLHVTPDSIDFDRLRRNSKLRKAPTNSRSQILPEEIFQNACENISEREAARMQNSLGNRAEQAPEIEPNVSAVIPTVPAQRTTRKDKFGGLPRIMMNGEKYVELKSRDGTKKMHYTEHQLSCLTLYFKIRFLMHDLKGTNPWLMTIKEVFNTLKDLKESKDITYQQLKHMAQINLFTAKWSDNNELLEIEIPTDRIEEASDKENLPTDRRATRSTLRTRAALRHF